MSVSAKAAAAVNTVGVVTPLDTVGLVARRRTALALSMPHKS